MGRCKKKLSNRANDEVRGLHTSFGASEKKKPLRKRGVGNTFPCPIRVKLIMRPTHLQVGQVVQSTRVLSAEGDIIVR